MRRFAPSKPCLLFAVFGKKNIRLRSTNSEKRFFVLPSWLRWRNDFQKAVKQYSKQFSKDDQTIFHFKRLSKHFSTTILKRRPNIFHFKRRYFAPLSRLRRPTILKGGANNFQKVALRAKLPPIFDVSCRKTVFVMCAKK